MTLRSEQTVLDLAADVDTLIGKLDAAPDSDLRSTALDAVSALAALYGEALRRLLHDREAGNGEQRREIADDPFITNLLIAHALHPESLQQRIEAALDEVRPYLRSHGGDVELLGVDGDYARVRLQGSCRGCASSADTLRQRVESAVKQAAPELLGIVTDAAAPSIGLVQLSGRKGAERGLASANAPRCELCSHPILSGHRHLLDLRERRLLCACGACAILFDCGDAGGQNYRLVPDRHQRLTARPFDDATWAELQLPVDVAFFFRNSVVGHPVAFYPGPAGATESLLGLDAWDALCRRSPLLGTLAPDVEAVLVCRARGMDEQWIVPVDCCYELTGIMRSQWRGLAGGTELWDRIRTYFEELELEHG